MIFSDNAIWNLSREGGRIVKNNNRTAIYVRLSKEDLNSGEKESESIQNQKSMLIDYAAKSRWAVYNIYCDEDYSGAYAGAENTRPEFNRMISDAQNGKFDIILCKSQSRFSRNMEVIEQYIHGRFAEWGIRFVSLIDNADTEVKGNKKARQINSLINEWYLEDLSENIKAVFRDKMKRGEYLATFPPYGYSKNPDNKNQLVINPTTATVVRQIFEWHSEGYGASKISRMLNDMGIPNPRKQQEMDGLRKTYFYSLEEKGVWSTTTIGDILNNRVYCGDVVQHRVEKVSYKSKHLRRVAPEEQIIIPDMHEAIISRELFEETQVRLSKRRYATGTGKVHILSGKVFCYCCGKPMQKNHSETTRGRIDYLRCRDKYAYATKEKCSTPNIRIDTVLQAIQMELIEKFKNITIAECDNEQIFDALIKKDNDVALKQSELLNLTKEAEKIEKSLEHLYSDRLNEVISLEQYISYNKSYNEKLNSLKEKIFKIEKELSAESDIDSKAVKDAIRDYLKRKCVDRKIIDGLIDKIEFGEINEETGRPMLKIFWAWG